MKFLFVVLVCPNCTEPNKKTERNGPESNAGYIYIGAVSFLSSLVALLLVLGAVLVYRYKLHQNIIKKQTSSHSDRTKENADKENSPDYEEVGDFGRTNGKREVSNTIAGSTKGNTDRGGIRNLTDDDDARPGTAAGSSGAELHPRQADVKLKKKKNDVNKLLFRHKTTHVRGQHAKNIELSNTIGKRQDQSSTKVYQSLFGRDDGNVDNGDEPVYSNVNA